MRRISRIERRYVEEVLKNEFRSSYNNVYCHLMEERFAKLHGVKYAISHVNGTQTLHTALLALGIRPEDEVIVPPLTMSSTSIAVLQNGSNPVFADVDRKTFNISAESIEGNLSNKTKAIISVSLYGLPPDYDQITRLCKKYGLFLIEDNAQALLARYKGKVVGQFGDFASYSFQASKHITCGEGGILITNKKELADKARKFSNLGYAIVSARHGKISKDLIQNPNFSRHTILGYNYRMSELLAALIFGQLERAESLVNQRIKVAKMYDDAIKGTDLLIRQEEPANCKNSYWTYAVILNTNKPDKDWFKFRIKFLKNGGDPFYAAWKLTYYEPLFQKIVQNMKGIRQRYKKGLCPTAEYLQPRLIQLKTNYFKLNDAAKQAEALYKTIKEF